MLFLGDVDLLGIHTSDNWVDIDGIAGIVNGIVARRNCAEENGAALICSTLVNDPIVCISHLELGTLNGIAVGKAKHSQSYLGVVEDIHSMVALTGAEPTLLHDSVHLVTVDRRSLGNPVKTGLKIVPCHRASVVSILDSKIMIPSRSHPLQLDARLR